MDALPCAVNQGDNGQPDRAPEFDLIFPRKIVEFGDAETVGADIPIAPVCLAIACFLHGGCAGQRVRDDVGSGFAAISEMDDPLASGPDRFAQDTSVVTFADP